MNDSSNYLTKKFPRYTHCSVLAKVRKSTKEFKIGFQLGQNLDDLLYTIWKTPFPEHFA